MKGFRTISNSKKNKHQITSICIDIDSIKKEQVKRLKTLYLILKIIKIPLYIRKIIMLKSEYTYGFNMRASNELLKFGYDTKNLLNEYTEDIEDIINGRKVPSKWPSPYKYIEPVEINNEIKTFIIHKYPIHLISKHITNDKFYSLALIYENIEAIEFYNKNIRLNNTNMYARDLCKHDKFKNIKYSLIDKNKIDYTYVVIGYCEAGLYNKAMNYYTEHKITDKIIDFLIGIDCAEFLKAIVKDFIITERHIINIIGYEKINCANFILFETEIINSLDIKYIMLQFNNNKLSDTQIYFIKILNEKN